MDEKHVFAPPPQKKTPNKTAASFGNTNSLYTTVDN